MSHSQPRSRRQFLALAAGAAAGAAMIPVAARAASLPVEGGIRWPSGQALPWFATPRHLDVADLSEATADQQLLLTTLQGIVNRTRPRIFLLQPQNEGLYTWLDDLDIGYTVASDPMSLLTSYRSEITGAVLYDSNVAGTVNVATTLAGLHDAVATSAELASSAGLPVIADLTGKFTADLDAYTWAVTNLWPHTTHRMMIGLDPGISGYLRDYAVANRGFAAFLDPGVPAELALLEQILSDIPQGSPYLGWWPSDVTGESDGTQVTSQYGLFVVASDYSANLTVFGGARSPVSGARQRSEVLVLENKIYVTFTVTDGDNLQYDQHRMRQIWDDPNRGTVPLNWTVQPLGVDAAPAFLSYYQRTATGDDYFMSGPSGAGYVYPGDWPAGTLGLYTGMTRRYFDLTGIDAPTILNRYGGQDVSMDEATARRYVTDVRPLGVLEAWGDYTWTTSAAGTTPLSYSWLASTVAEAQQAIAAASQGWDGSVPLFLSIGIDAWNLAPTDVLTIASSLSDDYAVVRGDQYFSLIRKMNLTPAGPNLLGDAPTGQLDWSGPVENGVGSVPGTLTTDATTPQGASAVQWTETSAAPNTWIWVDPVTTLAAGAYYKVTVTLQGSGDDIYLDFWNGQLDLTTNPVQITDTPLTLTLRAWVPAAAQTHLQVRTAASGSLSLYASAASIQLLTE
jgi:hypothetical protein